MIGHLLRPVRASARRSPLVAPALNAPSAIAVSSSAFTDGGPMPTRCAGPGVGDNVSPQLQWSGVPADTEQLVLVLDDLDVPLPTPLFHSAAVLEPSLRRLEEGGFRAGPGVRIIPTRLSKTGYSGPRPIRGHGPHRYRFHLLALACPLPGETLDVTEVLAASAGHVVARGLLTGTYER